MFLNVLLCSLRSLFLFLSFSSSIIPPHAPFPHSTVAQTYLYNLCKNAGTLRWDGMTLGILSIFVVVVVV